MHIYAATFKEKLKRTIPAFSSIDLLKKNTSIHNSSKSYNTHDKIVKKEKTWREEEVVKIKMYMQEVCKKWKDVLAPVSQVCIMRTFFSLALYIGQKEEGCGWLVR